MTAPRTIRLASWAAVLLVALGAAGLFLGSHYAGSQRGVVVSPPLGGPFELIDQNGDPITEAVFRNQPSVAFFGFTYCPDICPTALSDMTVWMADLGPKAERMRFVFITVDPERDTPEVLKDYVGAFSDQIIAITGEPEAVAAMLKSYHVYSRKVPLDGGDYTMDHTASIFLLDPSGALAGTISPQEDSETAIAKLRRLVAE